MSGSGFNGGIDNQKIELNLYKIGALVAIILLGLNSIYFFQRTQSLEAETDRTASQLSDLRSQLENTRSELENTNETLEFVQERNSEIKQENGQLRMIADRPLVKIDYKARTGAQPMNVELDAANYGNTTAEGIQATCQVYREGADPSYDSFSLSIDQLANRTVKTVTRQISLSEQPRNTDEIICQVDACEGLCQPMDERIDLFHTNHPRRELN